MSLSLAGQCETRSRWVKMEPQRRHNLFLGEVTTHYDDAAIEFLIDVDWVSEEFN